MADARDAFARSTEDTVDSEVDGVYNQHLEYLQAMASAGVCYSAMLSPTGQCSKPRCPHRHDRESFKYGVVEQIVKYMTTQGYKDAVQAGLMDPIRVKPGWDLAIPPPEARATLPRNDTPGSRQIQQCPQASGTPAPTLQAERYGSRSGKLHVLSPVHKAEEDEFEDLPELAEDDYDPDPDDPPEHEPYEILDDGTRLYHLANSVVGGMLTITVSLSCGVNLHAPAIEVDGPLDTGATMCYIANSLLNELEPHLDPAAIKRIASKVRMGAPPDHISDRQVDLRVRWNHQGHACGAILRFVVLQTDNLRIILGLNAILLAGLLDLLVGTLKEMRRQAQQPSMFLIEDAARQEPEIHAS